MSALSILALQNAALLRALDVSPETSKGDLAAGVGKDRSNLNRSIAALAEAGLLIGTDDGQRGLTDEGRALLAAIDRAENTEAAPGLPGADRFPQQIGDIRLIRHAQILPDHANARTDWDSDEAKEELDALRADIVQVGLLQNLIVRADTFGDAFKIQDDGGNDQPLFTLIGGERRWRAIGLAIQDDDWPADRPIPCRVIDVDDLGHRLAALSENLQRRNLNPLEKARAFDGLAQAFADQGLEDNKINREIADRVGVTIEHVQQHRAFMKLDDADQARLALPKDDPKRLSISDARKKLAARKEKEDAWKPSDHPAAEQLILAEMIVALRDRGTYFGAQLPVDQTIIADPVAQQLAEKNIISMPAGPHDGWGISGHFVTAMKGWAFSDACRTAWPGLDAADECDRHSVLHDLQAKLVDVESTGLTFLTPWLNGPFRLTPEGQVIADREEAAAQARDDAAAERRAEADARNNRWTEARQRHLSLMAAAQERPEAGEPAEITAISQDLDRPLPWTLMPTGEVVAANGATVHRRQSAWLEHDLAIGQLIVVAANTAAQQATPAIPNEDVEEPEQDIDGADPDAADEDDDDQGEDA